MGRKALLLCVMLIVLSVCLTHARRRRLQVDHDLVECPRRSRRGCQPRAVSVGRRGRAPGQRYQGGRWERGRRRFGNEQEEFDRDYDSERIGRRRGHW
ncbi:hypothetical protein AAVH_18574 [Aphelenchoides avenae]|nr:hypothetical protein AAVH_18574 [Aphelenchus avenae]